MLSAPADETSGGPPPARLRIFKGIPLAAPPAGDPMPLLRNW
jgi:hypothetical protein